MSIDIHRNPSLFDQPVDITILGLSPHQQVTVGMRICVENKVFVSHACFCATKSGTVSLAESSSFQGSYIGTNQMGLFSFLLQAPGQREGLRFVPAPVDKPLRFELSAVDGHVDLWASDKPLRKPRLIATSTCVRLVIDPSKIQRILVAEGGIRGALFIPKDIPEGRKLPGVIDVYGTAGGLMEQRAAILASHGFAVLALAYFNYPGIPTDLNDVDMMYFETAIDWLNDHPSTTNNGIGILGISYGAVIALFMSTVAKKVAAVVSVNGEHVFDPFFPMKYRGTEVPNIKKIVENQSGFGGAFSVKSNLKPDSHFIHKVENCQSKYLLLCSLDDGMVDAVKSAEVLSDRLGTFNMRDRLQYVAYEGAGHLLEPPFMPFCKESHHKILDSVVDWGGEPVPHVQAQIDGWNKTISFFAKHVGQPMDMADPNLENDYLHQKSKL